LAPRRTKASLQKQTETPAAGDAELRRTLRKKYAEIQNEPIPERLQVLIEALRKAESDLENRD